MGATYADVIKEHARLALQIYKGRLPELQQLSGLQFGPDGSNTARTQEDVQRYLSAVKSLGGPVSYISAKMVLTNAINKFGLPPVAL